MNEWNKFATIDIQAGGGEPMDKPVIRTPRWLRFGRVSCSIRGPYLKEPQWQLNIFSRDDRREIVFFVRKNSIRKLRFPFNKCFDATRSIVGGKTEKRGRRREGEGEGEKKRKKGNSIDSSSYIRKIGKIVSISSPRDRGKLETVTP